MPGFLVAANRSDPSPRVDGVDMAVVFANDAADARAMAKAKFAIDGDTSWDNATTTQLAAAADMQGFRLRARVGPPAGGADVADATYTGIASDTIDLMGDGIVLLLNALPNITGAAYNSTTQLLTVASVGDALGDHTLVVEVLPPAVDFSDNDAIPGFVGAIVHEGIAAAVLTAAMAADSFVIPNLLAVGKQS